MVKDPKSGPAVSLGEGMRRRGSKQERGIRVVLWSTLGQGAKLQAMLRAGIPEGLWSERGRA